MIFETPILARSIIAGVMLIAGMFCVAWYLPKLAPQYATEKARPNATPIHRKPSRLEHDSVLWEDAGRSSWGHISVVGPLCPKDFAFLGTEGRGKIESHADGKTTISKSEYHSRLFCPECKSKYTLGKQPKTIQESENEVCNRFEGKRRREQETK